MSKLEAKMPLYSKIAAELEEEIVHNQYAEISIPTELQLADRFNVNRHTIRRAVDKLVMKGMVERKRGVGLSVTHTKSFCYELDQLSKVSTNVSNAGMVAGSRVHKRYLEASTNQEANWLKASPGIPLLNIETLRYADEALFGWVCHKFVYKDFSKVYRSFSEGSIHEFIKEAYGIELQRAKTSIFSILSGAEEAEIFRIPMGRPMFKILSLNCSVKTGEPVEFSSGILRGDMVELKNVY